MSEQSANPFGTRGQRWSRRRLLRTGAGLAALPVFGGLLAACGADDEEPAASGTTAAGTAAPGSGTAAAAGGTAASGDTIKVGILHSLSGTMAVSEVSVKDAEILAIEEINAAGGVLGKQIEPMIEDGASDWPTFAEKAKKLIQSDDVAATFGCWTSASRKAVLPVYESDKALLFYPVQYEGLESSPYIYYMGATTNQQIVPSVEYLLEEGKKKFFLLGSDYVFPRTANQIIKAQLEAAGGETLAEEYTPLGHTDYSTVISKIQAAQPGRRLQHAERRQQRRLLQAAPGGGLHRRVAPDAVGSRRRRRGRGIGADVHGRPPRRLELLPDDRDAGEQEVRRRLQGEVRRRPRHRRPARGRATSASSSGRWREKAGSIEVEAVQDALAGMEFAAPEGLVTVNGENQHISKTVRIGKIREDGLIDTISAHSRPRRARPVPRDVPVGRGVLGRRRSTPRVACRRDATRAARPSGWGSMDCLSQVFNGLSVGSILLLVALGLAFSFGLMNVINMAHGELIMVGAYCRLCLAEPARRRCWARLACSCTSLWRSSSRSL